MISVATAQQIIQTQQANYGTKVVSLQDAVGAILAEDLYADRDLPPCNRATMDGIGINYTAWQQGIRTYKIEAVQAAGMSPITRNQDDGCVEVMTGASLHESVDTVIRYEDLRLVHGQATVVTEAVRQGQNIHRRGKDRNEGDIVASRGQRIGPALVSMAASVGYAQVAVAGLPRVHIITTGGELVPIEQKPESWELRRSNGPTLQAILQPYGITAEWQHVVDDQVQIHTMLKHSLERADVLLLSGGVSMGKYDYLPQSLAALGVEQLFHKVAQRPGKPFWFGRHSNGALVFAFPGNPVSAFLCMYRYFVPWLESAMGLVATNKQPVVAMLGEDVEVAAPLQYFVQVTLRQNSDGVLTAMPIGGNGSGDFANLVEADAFMELPIGPGTFRKGMLYPVWPFKTII